VTEALVTALAAALGGRHRTVLAPPGKTAAAVLVPLLAVDGAPSLLFTRRSNLMPHHQGQIAFPGGRHHPDADADLAATLGRDAADHPEPARRARRARIGIPGCVACSPSSCSPRWWRSS